MLLNKKKCFFEKKENLPLHTRISFWETGSDSGETQCSVLICTSASYPLARKWRHKPTESVCVFGPGARFACCACAAIRIRLPQSAVLLSNA